MTSSHSEPDIITQLERLNLKTDSNTKAISELAEIVKYQVIQSERERLNYQNCINDINQRQQAQLEAIVVGFREISSRVDAFIQQAEIDRNTFIEHISEIAEGLEEVQEQAAADRQQAAIDRQAFQQEIRHIWEYLMGQQRNRSSP